MPRTVQKSQEKSVLESHHPIHLPERFKVRSFSSHGDQVRVLRWARLRVCRRVAANIHIFWDRSWYIFLHPNQKSRRPTQRAKQGIDWCNIRLTCSRRIRQPDPKPVEPPRLYVASGVLAKKIYFHGNYGLTIRPPLAAIHAAKPSYDGLPLLHPAGQKQFVRR